jgi:eukaryotic-like serine/threonine-protein kinase
MTGPEMSQGNLVAGRYRLDRHLGEGGMGSVWAATHVVTRRSVAMKFLKPALQDKPEVRQRFLREAQAASALRHPNVVEVLDVFDLEDRSPVMVMELLDGETLGQKLLRDERLSAEETAALMLPVVAAVGSAHAAGIVHRDLKPENIFLARVSDGIEVKVLDFGIAKLSAEHYLNQGQSVLVTEAGSMLGTPCYMAPEQISNVGVDHRADIWSLGVILYECLSGTRPIEGQNLAEVVARLLNEAITPLDRLAPELPHEVSALVQQMLSRDAKRRPQDLHELSKVLGHYTHVRPPAFGEPRSRLSAADERVSAMAVRGSFSPRTPTGSRAPVVHNPTMQSAPAVGLDATPGGANVIPVAAPANKNRPLLIGAAVFLVALALLWTFGFAKKPDATTQTSTSARATETATGQTERAQSPPVAEKLPPPAVSPTVSSGPALASEDKPSPTKLRAVRPAAKPVRKPQIGVAKGSSADSTEDTLFSGRK